MTMLKSILTILVLAFFIHSVKAETYFEPIEPRWDVSPNQIQYSALALGLVGTALVVIRPEVSRPLIYLPKMDEKHNFDVPDWAYKLGDKGAQWMIGVPYLYYFGLRPKDNWAKAYVYTEALLFTHGSITIAKYSIGRQRPDKSNNLSFPSGHTAQAFTVASWFATDMYRTHRDSPMRYVYLTVPYAFASFVGATRIGGKKHYFSDVLVGGTLGTIIGYFMYDFHFDENGRLRNPKGPIFSVLADPATQQYGMNATFSF